MGVSGGSLYAAGGGRGAEPGRLQGESMATREPPATAFPQPEVPTGLQLFITIPYAFFLPELVSAAAATCRGGVPTIHPAPGN